MAALRPTQPNYEPYQRHYSRDESGLRPHKSDHRNRSSSRTPPSKYTNYQETPRRYISNESRSRKTPPSPSVEDGGSDPDGVKMRGKPDQKPMLIEIGAESSTSDSSGPLTPDGSLLDGQGGHVRGGKSNVSQYKAEKTARPPVQVRSGNSMDSDRRGRQQGLTVDTEYARSVSRGGDPTVNLQRARSPYAYRPTQRERLDDRGTPTASMRSPEVVSPAVLDARKHVTQTQTGSHDSYRSVSRNEGRREAGLEQTRPGDEFGRSIHGRRASTMPLTGSPMPANAAAARHPKHSRDDSESDNAAHSASRPSHLATANARTVSHSSREALREQPQPKMNPYQPESPPRSPLSPDHTRGTFLNRDTLLNGQGLQHLNSVLEAQHKTIDRTASPRPSPRPSPNASPFPSPPGTPPTERGHRKARALDILKKDSPASHSSSPLSSRPSSPMTAAQPSKTAPNGHAPPGRNYLSQERRTSTWDTAPRQQQQLDPQAGLRIDVRAPSPSPNRQQQRGSSPAPPPALRQHSTADPADMARTSRHASLQPIPMPHRQRSSSNVEHTHRRPSMSSHSRSPYIPADAQKPVPGKGEGISPSASTTTAAATAAAAGATLGAGLLAPGGGGERSRSTAPDASHHRHRSRSRAASDARPSTRSRSSAPAPLIPASDQDQPVLLPQCPRPQPVANYDDWFTLERSGSSIVFCPDCRRDVFGSGYERSFRRIADRDYSVKRHCALNDPWIRLALLITFAKQRADTRILGHLAEVSLDELPCPRDKPVENLAWYHLRDSETGRDFADFQVCSHCVGSLETIYPILGEVFYRSHDLKSEPRVCNLRSDVQRFGKYLNSFIAMADTAKQLDLDAPETSDFIWEVKLLTIISPCKGDAVHYGEDMHTHPELPGFTVCEECYYKTVRPFAKPTSSSSSKIARGVTPEATEIVGGAACKLYSPRMKQVFETACRERDFDYLAKAVRKRTDLQLDLEEAKMLHAREPGDAKVKEDLDWLMEKWRKLERRHD